MSRFACLALLLLSSGIAVSATLDDCPILPSTAHAEWTHKAGPDFDVCYATRTGLGDQLFGVYLGNAPNFRPDPSKAIAPGNVGGQHVTWYPLEPATGEKPYSRQTVISLGSKFPTSAHVWVIAGTEQELRERLSILMAIKFQGGGGS